MDVTSFAELVGKVPFLLFPAVRLQQTMREKFGGTNLWGKVQKLLNQTIQFNKDLEQRTKFNQHKELQKEKELEFKLKMYGERSEDWLKDYKLQQDKLRHPLRQVRVRRRRASDGMIGVNMDQLFEQRLPKIDYLVDLKQKLLKKNIGRDQPVVKDRLAYSMIWDDFSFMDDAKDKKDESILSERDE